MKKARLILTPLEYEFISIYHISPEALFDRLCNTMDSKDAAKEINKRMEIAWKRMQTVDRDKHEMYVKGFKPLGKDRIPFDAT